MEQALSIPVQPKPNHTVAIAVGGFVVLGLGTTAFFLFGYKDENGQTWFQRKKSEAAAKKSDAEQAKEAAAKATAQPYTPPAAPSGFPIKSANRGELVKRLQRALKNIWGQTLAGSNGGIDGVFGTSTLAGLRAIGYGDVVTDESVLQDIEKHVNKAAALAAIASIPTPNTGSSPYQYSWNTAPTYSGG